MTTVSHTLLRLAAALVVLMAVGVAGFAFAGISHAQDVDDSPPPTFDLSIVFSSINQPRCSQELTVKNNVVGDQLVHVTLARVEIVTTDGTGATSTDIWTIRDLPAGGSVTLKGGSFPAARNRPSSGDKRPLRRDARIIESVPAEPQALRLNNAAEPLWGTLGRSTYEFNDGDVSIGVSVSDRFPQGATTTTFTVHAANFVDTPRLLAGCDYDHTQFDVQVAISLSPGLTFAETQPQAPSGTTFATSTGIWDVGDLRFSAGRPIILALPVEVTLSNDSLAELPLAERCLTAEVSAAPSWPAKRENDTSTVCLGEDPPVLLISGDMALFEFYPCVGVTDYPCTSADTLELVVEADRNKVSLPGLDRVDSFDATTSGRAWLQPESVYIHIDDAIGRGIKSGSVIWSTVDTMDLRSSQTRLTSSWAVAEAVTVTAPGGGDAPGRWVMVGDGYDVLNAPDSSKVSYEAYSLGDLGVGSEDFYYGFDIEFSALGTYRALYEISGRPGATPYTDSGTYTFHVGPVSELEVRDGGASPAVADGQRAYTIMAVNNGPDVAPEVRVTGLPTGVTEFFASEGEYDSATGVWTIGELHIGPFRRASGKTAFPILTLAATSTTTITATIENTQDYCVRIKTADTDPENDLKCVAGSPPTGYTEHTAAYFDHIEKNNTATIEARAGTGEGAPGVPSTTTVEIHGSALALLSWTPVHNLYGHPVTGYVVERSAGPGQETVREVKGTIYADAQGGGGNLAYRVRAVNELGVKGPWSQVVETQAQMGRASAPRSLSASADGLNAVMLSWSAPANNGGEPITGYRVDYSAEDNVVRNLARSHATTTYEHSGLLAGANYCYRVAAVNANGAGDFSAWVCATTEDVPGAPAGLRASASGRDAVSLSWNAPADDGRSDITGYRIEYSTGSWQLAAGSHATTTYEHSGLDMGTSYCYRVAAINAIGTGPFSGRACATTEDVPGAPRNLSATANGTSTINLSWQAPSHDGGSAVTGYDVEYSDNAGVSWHARATVQSGTFTYPDTGLLPASRRCYRVKAINVHGEGPLSGEACATTEGAPSAPRNLSARPDSETSVRLSWDVPSDNGGEAVIGYVVERYSADTEEWVNRVSGHTTETYVDTELATGLNYCYRVAATNSNGTGDYSGQACATTEGLPDAPENLSATVDGKTSITLTWDRPTDTGGATIVGYRVDYSTDNGVEWMTLEHDYERTTYGHSGLLPGGSYCYRVAAAHDNGVGPFSDQVCATTEGAPTDLPSEPENLRLTHVGRDRVTLKWDPPSLGGEVEYYEYRYDYEEPVRVTGRTTQVSVRGLSEGFTYDFKVRAGNALGAGEWAPPPGSLPVQAAPGGMGIASRPLELEFKKDAQGQFGPGSFNVKLGGSPKWPMSVGLLWEGDVCLTDDLPYLQHRILLPGDPKPSKAFWSDPYWGPPGDRYAAPWNSGINFQVDASRCSGGETAVVYIDVATLPFGAIAGVSLWDDEDLNLDREEWEQKWGIPFQYQTGPSVKLSAVDD